MSAPCGRNSESELGNVKERLRDYYVSRKSEMSAPCGRNSESELGNVKERLRDYYVSRDAGDERALWD